MPVKYRTSYLRQQKKMRLKKRSISFLVLACVASITYFFVFSGVFKIKKIEVVGTARVPKEIVHNEVSKVTNNKNNWPLGNNLLFANVVLNKQTWGSDIEQLNFHKNLFSGTLKVLVKEKQPVAKISWNNVLDINNLLSKEVFFLDDQGVLFKSDLVPNKVLPTISISGQINKSGQKIWDPTQVSSFLKLIEYFYQDGTLKNDSLNFTYSLNRPSAITHHLNEKYDIYLTLNKDIEDAFKAATGFALNNSDNKTAILNYIDARFYPEKLYYK